MIEQLIGVIRQRRLRRHVVALQAPSRRLQLPASTVRSAQVASLGGTRDRAADPRGSGGPVASNDRRRSTPRGNACYGTGCSGWFRPCSPGRIRGQPRGPHRSLDDAGRCLALALYWEAKTEGPEGMRAVASVVLNRVAHPEFPDTVCAVVTQGGEQPPCQFSWWCDGRSDQPTDARAWRLARQIAQAALAKAPPDRDPRRPVLPQHRHPDALAAQTPAHGADRPARLLSLTVPAVSGVEAAPPLARRRTRDRFAVYARDVRARH